MAPSPSSAGAFSRTHNSAAFFCKAAEAEKLYRESIAKNVNLLAARHNLALLLAARADRQPEAIGLWRDNLQRNPDYLPSRLSLAGTLAARGDTAAAIEEYLAPIARWYGVAETGMGRVFPNWPIWSGAQRRPVGLFA